jgi:hypothetical protein
MTDKTRAVVDYAYDDNGKEMRDAVYSAIHDKVMAHIEAHKKEVAQNLIAPEGRFALQDEPTEQQDAPVENA